MHLFRLVIFFPYTCSNSNDLTGEIWDVYVECKNGAKEPLVTAPIDKGLITMRNLISWKEQLGYGVRDYMYYKKRSGNDLATLEVLDYSRDVDAMLKDSAAERKIRLLLAKEKEPERHVQVTPLKRSRGNESDQEDEDDDTDDIDESIDAYKQWLEYLQKDKDSDTGVYAISIALKNVPILVL
jgi:hypothetical protein